MSIEPLAVLTAIEDPIAPPSANDSVLRRLIRTPTGVVGGCLIVGIVLAAVFGPFLWPHSPTAPVAGGVAHAFAAPTSQHWLGLDGQGRDVLARTLAGARLTLLVGISAVAVGVVIGTAVGALAATIGGMIDSACMRGVDLLLAFPSLLLALGIVAAFGQGRFQVVVAVGITTVPLFARQVRSEIGRQIHLDYVHAARMYGASTVRIMLRHLIPNSAYLIGVQAALVMSTAIIEIAALGYLGLGPADPRSPEWGAMLTEATSTMRSEPLLVLWPSLALVATAIAFNLFGDGLQRVLGDQS
ncbi:ABC transporter permease [Mycolicibacterium sp.]|uniref:ABC transporter permease n=1 Tax=Mycolicibacterium sp. TaxID=2320850 RepID=UPI0037C77DC9